MRYLHRREILSFDLSQISNDIDNERCLDATARAAAEVDRV
jgi:hypothetical protein